jgi:hypothetical protein
LHRAAVIDGQCGGRGAGHDAIAYRGHASFELCDGLVASVQIQRGVEGTGPPHRDNGSRGKSIGGVGAHRGSGDLQRAPEVADGTEDDGAAALRDDFG